MYFFSIQLCSFTFLKWQQRSIFNYFSVLSSSLAHECESKSVHVLIDCFIKHRVIFKITKMGQKSFLLLCTMFFTLQHKTL